MDPEIHLQDDEHDGEPDDGHRDECPIHRTNETHTHTHTHTKRKRKKERKKVAIVVVDQKTNKQHNKLTDQSPVRHLHERRHGIFLECLTSLCRRPTVCYREQHQQHPLQKRASINKKVKAFAFFSFLKILLSSLIRVVVHTCRVKKENFCVRRVRVYTLVLT